MPRTKTSQSKHDREVRKIAEEFAERGYDVDADVRGYPQPKTIGGVRPDVIAKRGTERVIVEVETEDSKDSARDLKQQREFKKAAKRSKRTKFIRKVV